MVVLVAVGIVGGLLLYSNQIEPGSDEDVQFIAWMEDTSENMLWLFNVLVSAEEAGDYDDIVMYAGLLYDYTNRTLDEIDNYPVSSALEPTKK